MASALSPHDLPNCSTNSRITARGAETTGACPKRRTDRKNGAQTGETAHGPAKRTRSGESPRRHHRFAQPMTLLFAFELRLPLTHKLRMRRPRVRRALLWAVLADY